MKIDIPGFGPVDIRHVVCDYNGTLAVDGHVKNGVKKGIQALSDQVRFHVITADTFGRVEKEMEGANCTVTVIPKGDQTRAKQEYVRQLGPDQVLAVGNGANDRLMLSASRIGVVVLLEEGTAVSSLTAADILVKDILDVFAYLKTPERLIATLRTA